LAKPTDLHFHGLHIPPAADDPALLVDGETIPESGEESCAASS
jgi:hypothetical protein